jgi:hypothetical protein
MTNPKRDPDRAGELEDALKSAELRLVEMRAERDEAHELVARMEDHVNDAKALIDSWKESFDMELRDDGQWHFEDGFGDRYDKLLADYGALLKDWNKYVAAFNSNVGQKSPGRPLNASEAQCIEVLKLRKRKISLRDIAEDTSLALSTVRTIIDRDAGTDRSTIKRLQRLDPQNARLIAAKARKRTRDALPERITRVSEDAVALLKEGKGLGRG